MTPEEAIKILKPLFEHCKGKNECLGYIEHFFTKDEEEALDMAIKALEQTELNPSYNRVKTELEPCEDCISRTEVLDIINFEDEWLFDANSHNADTKIAFSTIKSKISEMPSVTPKAESEDKK